jgi:SnoaL-like polyketide cyclase/SnoaL-like domain
MRTTLAIALVACLGTGCKKRHTQETPSGSVTEGSGSAGGGSGSGSGSAAAEPPKSIEDIAKRYEECWKFWSDGRFDQYRGCYATEATGDAPGVDTLLKSPEAIVGAVREERAAFPDMKGHVELAMVAGHTAIGMVTLAGTNTGAMRAPKGEVPATNKKIGVTLAIVSQLDDQGRAKHESVYFDNQTLLAQLGMIPAPAAGVRPVPDVTPALATALISKDDAGEKANRDVVVRFADALTKHDAAGAGELLADDVVWSEVALPKDLDKKGMLAQEQALWQGFSKLKTQLARSSIWTAGDYVVAVETIEGWNDGDVPMWKLAKSNRLLSLPALGVYKIAGGKIKHAWLFYESLGRDQQLGIGLAASPAGPPVPAGDMCCCELKKPKVEPLHAGSGSGSAAGSAALPKGPGFTLEHAKLPKKECDTLGLCVSPTQCTK